MWLTRSHLGTVMILCFALGGLVCVALPAMTRDIIQWRKEFKNSKGDEQ